jgi:hypothetical protein
MALDMLYMLGVKSELAVERRDGIGRCLVLRMIGEPEGSELSEVIAGWLGDSSWALLDFYNARSVYRRLRTLGRVRYEGGRTHDDRPIWLVETN